MKLAIGDELQTLFHPIVNATKQAAERTRKELESMKKTFRDNQKHAAEETAVLRFGSVAREPAGQRAGDIDKTFAIFERDDGQQQMGNIIVTLSEDGMTLSTEDNEYDYTAGLQELIWLKHPRFYTPEDMEEYEVLIRDTLVVKCTNPKGTSEPKRTWKYRHIFAARQVPLEKVVEEKHEDSEGIETAPSEGDSTETASIADIGETADSGSSPLSTRSGKARKTKDRLPFYIGWKGEGVVYLPGDINGLAKKLQLLAAEFFAGNTTVMIVYKSRRFAVRRYQYGGSGIVSTIGSLLARFATKAMLATAANAALKGSLKAAKRADPHLIAHNVVGTIADAAKKRKRVDINVKSSQEPQSKKALVDTGTDVNALID